MDASGHGSRARLRLARNEQVRGSIPRPGSTRKQCLTCGNADVLAQNWLGAGVTIVNHDTVVTPDNLPIGGRLIGSLFIGLSTIKMNRGGVAGGVERDPTGASSAFAVFRQSQ